MNIKIYAMLNFNIKRRDCSVVLCNRLSEGVISTVGLKFSLL